MTATIHDLQEFKKKKIDRQLLEEAKEIEQEHSEFIKLLRFFVEIQEPKCKLVTISKPEGCEYSIINENNEELVYDTVHEDTVLNEDDLLVNVLITNCPSKIILRTAGLSKELIETISLVFEGRVSILEEENHGAEK